MVRPPLLQPTATAAHSLTPCCSQSPDQLQNHIFAAHGRGVPVIVRVPGPNVGYPASPGVTQPWGVRHVPIPSSGSSSLLTPSLRRRSGSSKSLTPVRTASSSPKSARSRRSKQSSPTAGTPRAPTAHHLSTGSKVARRPLPQPTSSAATPPRSLRTTAAYPSVSAAASFTSSFGSLQRSGCTHRRVPRGGRQEHLRLHHVRDGGAR